jgi:hypothetical protein
MIASFALMVTGTMPLLFSEQSKPLPSPWPPHIDKRGACVLLFSVCVREPPVPPSCACGEAPD